MFLLTLEQVFVKITDRKNNTPKSAITRPGGELEFVVFISKLKNEE
jgi:hypothetical protein